MFRFLVFDNGRPAKRYDLRNAYLLGADGNPMRAHIRFHDGEIQVEKQEPGAAALALQHPVGDCGALTVQTCQLLERNQPYLLTLELARCRLMMLYHKLEDWAMFDIGPDHPVTKRIDLARRLFIEGLCHQHHDPIKTDRLAQEALSAAIDGAEELALAHANLLLGRRKATDCLPARPVGVGVRLEQTGERLRAGLHSNFDYLSVFTPWRQLAPEEGDYQWAAMDNWAEWAGRHGVPITAGPIISFQPHELPSWLYIWEHDYETIRDLIYEHVERVVKRYRNSVMVWNVVAGLHVNNHLTFSFDQLMDLTRMTTMLVKKIQPAAEALIEIQQPFGEYYGANQRSIPPLTYADLVVQGAINFDGFALKLLIGQASPGQFVRDLMQLSHLLDQFAFFGKPVHLMIGAPSEFVPARMIRRADTEAPLDSNCGCWRHPWSPIVQGHWLEAMYHIAMSKPFVESVSWCDLHDGADIDLPFGGLLSQDMTPKSAFKRLVTFRARLLDLEAESDSADESQAQAFRPSAPTESALGDVSSEDVPSGNTSQGGSASSGEGVSGDSEGGS